MAAGWEEIRSVLGESISLAVLGTILTALIAGLAAKWLFGLSLAEGLLVGSILASTDGGAVFAVLRGSTLRRRLARTLEGEAGLNDPVAVLLVLGFMAWATNPHYRLPDFLWLFAREIGIGAVIGAAVAAGTVLALRRLRLPSAGLYPVVSIAAVAVAYGAADTLHGSGFLAVYLTGLAVGSVSSPAQSTIATFHDGLAWVAQLSMFLVLGLLVFPSQLGSVAIKGTVLALVVALIARPIAVAPGHAAAGRPVRELELPREALLNLIIRRDQAVPPRGSTRIEPGDHLHVLVRQEAAVDFRRLLRRWRDDPLHRVQRRRPVPRATAPIYTTRPWGEQDGDLARPTRVAGIEVVEQLRTRRDQAGALVALADGRYASTGPMTAVGSASQLQDAARRRLRQARDDGELAWWREVTGALAAP